MRKLKIKKATQEMLCNLGQHKYTQLANGPEYKKCFDCGYESWTGKKTYTKEWDDHFNACGPAIGNCGNHCRYCESQK